MVRRVPVIVIEDVGTFGESAGSAMVRRVPVIVIEGVGTFGESAGGGGGAVEPTVRPAPVMDPAGAGACTLVLTAQISTPHASIVTLAVSFASAGTEMLTLYVFVWLAGSAASESWPALCPPILITS